MYASLTDATLLNLLPLRPACPHSSALHSAVCCFHHSVSPAYYRRKRNVWVTWRAESRTQVRNGYSATMAALSGRLPWLTALVLPQRHLEIPQRKRLSHSEPPRRDQQCLLLNAVCCCSERILCSHGYSEPVSTSTHTHKEGSALSLLLSLRLSRCAL